MQEHTQLLHSAVERAARAGVVADGGPATLVTLGYLCVSDTEPILSALVDLTGRPR